MRIPICLCRFAARLPAWADPSSHESVVQPLIEKHCVSCHRAHKAKAAVRLDGRIDFAASA